MHRLILAGTVALYVAVSCINIRAPFLRHSESAGTEFGKIARNFNKFGYLVLRLGPLDLSGPRLEDHGDWRMLYMTNRNILPTLYWSITWRLFGYHEWVFRASMILVGITNILLFSCLARHLLGHGRAALLATAFFGLSPMMIYHGQVAGQYACSFLMIQAVLLAYWRWREKRTGGRLALLFLWLFLGCNCGWPVYYAGLLVGIYELGMERRLRSPVVLAPAACVAFFGIHLLHLAWLDPRLIGSLASDAGIRAASSGTSPIEYIGRELLDVGIYHTVIVAALAGAWFVLACRSRERADWIIAGLILLGVEEVVFFRWAAEHDYLTFPLQLFFCLAAARALQRLSIRFPGRPAAAAAGAALLLFGAHSACFSYRRLTTFGAYEFYYRLARIIDAQTRPDEKVFVATDNMQLYTPFYADRYMTSYDAEEKRLITEIRAPKVVVAGDEDVLRWIEKHPERCDWIVATTGELTRQHVRFLADAPDDILRPFQVDVGDSKLRAGLERWVAEGKATRMECGGFLFYRLRKP